MAEERALLLEVPEDRDEQGRVVGVERGRFVQGLELTAFYLASRQLAQSTTVCQQVDRQYQAFFYLYCYQDKQNSFSSLSFIVGEIIFRGIN